MKRFKEENPIKGIERLIYLFFVVFNVFPLGDSKRKIP